MSRAAHAVEPDQEWFDRLPGVDLDARDLADVVAGRGVADPQLAVGHQTREAPLQLVLASLQVAAQLLGGQFERPGLVEVSLDLEDGAAGFDVDAPTALDWGLERDFSQVVLLQVQGRLEEQLSDVGDEGSFGALGVTLGNALEERLKFCHLDVSQGGVLKPGVSSTAPERAKGRRGYT